jgi:hypothetical protein
MGDEHGEACAWCQKAARAAWELRAKRLGAHERRVLLRAAPIGRLAEPILPPGPSHSSQTATRRAVASLQTVGLIVVPNETRRLYRTHEDLVEVLELLNRDYAVLRYAFRTDLGEAVVQVFGDELENSGRIRWVLRLADLTGAVQARCPHRSERDRISPVD